MAFPDMWDEVFLMSVELAAGTEIQMATIIDPTSLEFGPGDYPSESKPNAAGGRLWSQNPEEDGEITFDIWGIELDITSGVGLFQQFIGGAADASEPLTSDIAWPAGVNRVRDLYRIAILFTNDPAATTAAGLFRLSADGLTSGKGVFVESTSIALTSGELFTVLLNSSGELAANSGNVVSFSSHLEEDAGTVTSDYDVALFSRIDKQSFAAQYDAQGSVVKIQAVERLVCI